MLQMFTQLRRTVVFATALALLGVTVMLPACATKPALQPKQITTVSQKRCNELAGSPADSLGIGSGLALEKSQLAEALKACRAAAATVPIQPHYLFLYGRTLEAAKRYAEAIEHYTRAVGGGYTAAMYNLGAMYHNGRGVPRSDADAAAWYRKAAKCITVVRVFPRMTQTP
jgi:tetratricopeptide (TPR) repeat protein